MEEAIYQLTKLIPYFILFPIAAIVVSIVLKIISKKKINNSNVTIYGLLMNLNNKENFLISLLLIGYIMEIESIFVMEFSIFSVVFIYLPILLFDILCMSFIRIPVDLLESTFVIALLFFKNIFFSYMMEVGIIWYVLVLFVILCAFIVVFSTYTLTGNFNRILKSKTKVK